MKLYRWRNKCSPLLPRGVVPGQARASPVEKLTRYSQTLSGLPILKQLSKILWCMSILLKSNVRTNVCNPGTCWINLRLCHPANEIFLFLEANINIAYPYLQTKRLSYFLSEIRPPYPDQRLVVSMSVLKESPAHTVQVILMQRYAYLLRYAYLIISFHPYKSKLYLFI